MKKRVLLVIISILILSCKQLDNKKSEVKKISTEERMKWWQKARFGMFVHWGIYSVPAGFYKGVAQTNSAEWIMNKGKIPIIEYEKFAAQFNPTKFNAKEFVGLAKEAGMKYIVITAKHHDGFSMFNSESNPFNVVDATPFGRDVLKELAKECEKQGIKFGFYYSQAQDWHHPGGIGNTWDKTIKRVNNDEYVYKKALPEVKQLLTEYGPIAIFWWDTPRRMSKKVVDSLYHITSALQPNIITNDRLGEDYPGDYKTFERKLPNESPEAKYWEICQPISGSWGYRSDDNNFKSIPTLVHNLIDASSRGGNYLLNVSPTAQGTLRTEAVDRLKAIGRWMDKNGESIYGTQRSPCIEPKWGRITMKSKNGKETLYLNVYDWNDGGKLPIQLKNKVESCYLLTDNSRTFHTESSEDGIMVGLTGKAPNSISSVIVLKLIGKPNAIPRKPIGQDQKGVVNLIAKRAQFQNLQGPGAEYNTSRGYIDHWSDNRSRVYWSFTVDKPRTFNVEAEIASQENSEITVTIGENLKNTVLPSSGGYGIFKTVSLGIFKIEKAGVYEISLMPVAGKWKPINLKQVRLAVSK